MATTEQLMAKYGVAWFGFDEASGNVTDKLGNGYTGTDVTATRVQGWNGEGSAMSFNGTNSSISLNVGSNLTNEVSFRFKFKTNSTIAGYPLATLNAYKTQKGFAVYIGASGEIIMYWTQGADSYCFKIDSFVVAVNDGKWHDLFFSWDGKKESIAKLYIDNVIVGQCIAEYNNNGHAFNIALGRLSGFTGGWFTGQLDDLQIYNKALSPSDFTQKRLVVKTTDNTNLVLSPNTTRVKEVSNTAEYMMLAQGGVINEIDSAVDRPPIDFTKTTTEYEIVTNNRTPLGKGRMFTIPISSDFKTAMIEDNY